jgi:protein-tyrosine phosphatase
LHGRIVFVCTGNVFRSLTAEYALRARRPDLVVASAGTAQGDDLVPPEVSAYLLAKGFDVRAHRRRALTQDIIEQADLVVAMSLDHRDFIRARFGVEVPVFLECCGEAPAALLDLHEAVADYRTNPAAAVAHICATIDRIIDLTPRLARRVDNLFRHVD